MHSNVEARREHIAAASYLPWERCHGFAYQKCAGTLQRRGDSPFRSDM